MKIKKLIKILLFVTGIIVLTAVGIQMSFSFYFNSKIKNDLQQEIAKQTKNEYTLEISDLTTNVFTQSVYIHGFLLKPTLTANPGSPKYFASASEVNLLDFSLFAFLFKRNLTISTVELINPSGIIYRGSSGKTRPGKDDGNKFSLYGLFSKNINALRIVRVHVGSANIAVFDDPNDLTPSISSNDNELEISNIQINESVDKSGKLFVADQILLTINRFSYTTRDSLYSFHVKKLVASYTGSRLFVDSLDMIPNYNKMQFSAEAGKQTDRFRITIAKLDFSRMNVKLFFERNWFISEELSIDELIVSAHRNKNYIRKHERPGSVQQLLKDIPFYAAIDTIKLKNSRITYEEVAEGSAVPGKITFTGVNARITGFTSDTTLFSRYQALQVHADATFMDSGRLNGHYSFPLNTGEMVFDCSGKLVNMPFAEINPMIVPNAHISMKAGIIDTLEFSFHANETVSRGSMKFRYHDLKMEFLDKTSHKSGFQQDVLSFLAHGVLIKEDNPSHKQSLRVTEISYQRNPSRFIFNYTWKSMLSGIKPAVGIPDFLGK